MSVVFILVFAAIIIASAFLIAFVWAVKNGQYDDTYTPSVRILFDDLEVTEEKTDEEEKKKKGDRHKGNSKSVTNITDIQNAVLWKK